MRMVKLELDYHIIEILEVLAKKDKKLLKKFCEERLNEYANANEWVYWNIKKGKM